MQVPCQECELRACGLFRPITDNELGAIADMKREHITLPSGTEIVRAGEDSPELYTLYSGWAFRFKTLSDGRRQILNFLLPGDFIGVQQEMGTAAGHGVQALTDCVLCVFRRDALWELHRSAPSLSFSVTWLTSHEESMVDDNLLSVGRRSAEERIATLLIVMFKRISALHPEGGSQGVPFPLTQQHIADALGLSLVHTNKTLRKLEKRGLHRIENARLFLLEPRALERMADLYGDGHQQVRPLI
jgi:CRP/FNR family transcriptional regulator, anaerobic regulatory protein